MTILNSLTFSIGNDPVSYSFTDQELYDLDRYLWVDYIIESVWQYYNDAYAGRMEITDDEEDEIIKIVETIYSLEEEIMDLLIRGNIDFAMITAYKELHNVSNWPTRFC